MPKYTAQVFFTLDVEIDTDSEEFQDYLELCEAKDEPITEQLVTDFVSDSLSDDPSVFGEIEDLNNVIVKKAE